MVSQDHAIHLKKRERAVAAQWSVATRMHAVLAVAMAAAFALAVTRATTAQATTTITVNTISDTSASGTCTLRDAINTAQGVTVAGSSCNSTVDTTYLIVFQSGLTGTITLGSTLPTITGNLTITGPTGSPGITIDGGGKVQVMMVASATPLTLNKLTIAHGIADNGGGIENEGALTITKCIFSGNNVDATDNNGFGTGGGILNTGALTVINSTFSGNTVLDINGAGGGIENDGVLTVTNSIFSNNYGHDGGGIDSPGMVSVTNSTFFGNGADRGGGFEGGGTISNSTFSGNSADLGGGIYSVVGTLTVTNSTFSGNSGGSSGAGAAVAGRAGLKSTILANSFGSNCSGTMTDAGYNLSDDTSCGFSAIGSLNNTNPMLDSAGLRNNGGPTQTIALDSESPAIDAMPLADCTDQTGKPIITDQRGALRPDVGEAYCDIGAYEFQDLAGRPNCVGKSVSALVRQFGNMNAAAKSLGFPSAAALQNAIAISCGG